jgi:hypothetical protein
VCLNLENVEQTIPKMEVEINAVSDLWRINITYKYICIYQIDNWKIQASHKSENNVLSKVKSMILESSKPEISMIIWNLYKMLFEK